AEYIVAPSVNVEVIKLCRRYDTPVMPGAFTPTEVVAAWEAGADVVKIFPAEVGGPSYLKALRGPLPQVRMMPTGGGRPPHARAAGPGGGRPGGRAPGAGGGGARSSSRRPSPPATSTAFAPSRPSMWRSSAGSAVRADPAPGLAILSRRVQRTRRAVRGREVR